MKKIFIATVLLTVLSANIFSQTPEAKKPYIEVTGTSETEITPDEIYITITLLERNENKEKLTIEKQEDDLKQNLKELGIEMSSLVLNTANADYRKIRASKKDVITSKCYVLKVNNADMLDKVYKRLDKINAHDAYISRLSHSKITEFTKENRIKAIKAARDKAEYLLLAVNNTMGAPVQITETMNALENDPYGGYHYGRGYAANVSQSYSSLSSGSTSESFSGSGEDDISIRKIKIKASFLVRYEIAK
jgi:uncharacterized protein